MIKLAMPDRHVNRTKEHKHSDKKNIITDTAIHCRNGVTYRRDLMSLEVVGGDRFRIVGETKEYYRKYKSKKRLVQY